MTVGDSKRFALRRTFPNSWLERLYSENSDLFDVETLGKYDEIAVDEVREAELRRWVEAHGDEFDAVFRPDDRLGEPYKPIGIRVRPGETKELHARDLSEELRAGVLDLESTEIEGGKLRLTGRVPRLIPDSGLLGQMGRYEISIVFGDAEVFKVEDLKLLRAIRIDVAHHDPAARVLYVGTPELGMVEAHVGRSYCKVKIPAEPVQVRRWRRWRTA